MKIYMFDTNIFNHILDGSLDFEDLAGKALYCVTHIQLDEINNTKNPERRAKPNRIFGEFIQDAISTESFGLNSSRLGQAKLGGENIIPTGSAVWGVSKWGLELV